MSALSRGAQCSEQKNESIKAQTNIIYGLNVQSEKAETAQNPPYSLPLSKYIYLF